MTAFDASSRSPDRRSAWHAAFTLLAGRAGTFALTVFAVAGLVSIAVVLLLVGDALQRRMARVADSVQASVYLRSQVSRADAEALKGRLDQQTFVAGASLKTREDALAALAVPGGGLPLGRERVNPLPDVWVVTLRAGAPDGAGTTLSSRLSAARAALASWPEVESVDLDLRWVASLERWDQLMQRGHAIGKVVLLGIVAAFEACLFLLAGTALRTGNDASNGEPPRRGPLAIAGAVTAVVALLLAALLIACAVLLFGGVRVEWPFALLDFDTPTLSSAPATVIAVMVGTFVLGTSAFWITGRSAIAPLHRRSEPVQG